jgi:adenylate cyclase
MSARLGTPLSALRGCFQGFIPSVLATCSKDGVPNVTYLSHVEYVDATHVALSYQFFNKTQKNVAENPYAAVNIIDPVSFDTYELDLRFDHRETSGPLFDEMSARIDAIASHTGMVGIFKLLGADVYEVLAVHTQTGYLRPAPPEASPPEAPPAPSLRGELHTLSQVTEKLRAPRDLEGLYDAMLDALKSTLGFEHAMVLVPNETEDRLFTVASMGYGESGVGAEVAIGQGLIGTAAERRKSLRLADLDASLRYGRAIRAQTMAGGNESLDPEIPLPGLPDAQLQVAIPLVSHDRLFGVLAVESRNPRMLGDWQGSFLDIVGNVAATAIDNLMLRADSDEAPAEPPKRRATVAPAQSKPRLSFCLYKSDDCVFVAGKYLIRNVPGRILWKILRGYADEGRTEFSNRELRLDASLGLPAVKDNLESRLILLRKRLEQKCPELRMVSKCRGEFRVEVDGEVELSERA